MAGLVGRLLLALVLVTGIIATTAWSVSTAADSLALFRFEREEPASLSTSQGLITDREGFGPLERDVVSLDSARESVRVVRVGEPRARWPRSELLVGEHGARYADEPPHEGAWAPFALAAVLGVSLAALAGWLVVRLWLHLLRTGGFIIFGQRDPQGKGVTWLPGGGTHGGMGGQVPPYVPHNPDWDPENRIR